MSKVKNLALLSLAAVMSGCVQNPTLVLDEGAVGRLQLCSEMEQSLKPSFKFAGFGDAGSVGAGLSFDYSRPRIAEEQTRAMALIVVECKLWARGEPGHDADAFSEAMLKLSGVYVAGDDPATRDKKIAVLETQYNALLAASEKKPQTPAIDFKKAVADQAAPLSDDPEKMKTVNDEQLAKSQSPGNSQTAASEARTAADQGEEKAQLLATLHDFDSRLKALETPADGNDRDVSDDQGGNPRRGNIKTSRTYYSVFFGFNTADLSFTEQTYLNALIRDGGLKAGTHVRVVGFADDKGTERYNASLAKLRADRVAGFLSDSGVLVDGSTLAGKSDIFSGGREANRRVIIEVQ